MSDANSQAAIADAGSQALSVLRDVAAVSRERQLNVKAAGLAYHAFNTLVPLVILLLVGVSIADAFEPVVGALETATGLDSEIDRNALAEATGEGGAGRMRAAVIAFAVVLWSAARLFQAVNSAFTAVYGSRRSQSSLESVRSVSVVTASYTLLLAATVALGVALVGVLGVSVSLHLGSAPAVAASSLALLALLSALFFPMYYVFPQADVSVREVLPGTAFAALSWTVLAFGFRLYVSTAESVALFGIAGAVLLILTWVYLGGLCLLLGTVCNAVLADRVEPDGEWVPVDEQSPERV